MDFYIRKGSILPVLRMKLINDGRNDFKLFHDMMQTANITFSMIRVEDEVYKIANREGGIVLVNDIIDPNPAEYYIQYEWRSKDVDTPGLYKGEFQINFVDCGCQPIIVPIRNELFIHILPSITKSDCVVV